MRKLHYLTLALLALILGFSRTAFADQMGVTDSLTAVNAESRYGGDGAGTLGFQLSGTWSATLTFEATINGTTWTSVTAYNRASGTGATTATSNGTYVVSTAGVRYVRARVSSYTSGAVMVTGLLSPEQSVVDGGASSSGGGGGGDASAANQLTEIASLDALDDLVNTHDDAALTKHIIMGGYASAAAPTSVSADGDAVRAWYLRNGTAMVGLAAAGALVGGDATNGLDVDVTRLPSGTVAGSSSLPAGTNNIGDVDVLTLPALATGTNHIGAVKVDTLSAGANHIGSVKVDTLLAALVSRPAKRDSAWGYTPPAGGLVSTTAVKAKSAPGASTRACITSAQVINEHASTSSEIVIYASPGAGAATDTLFRWWAQAAGGGVAGPIPVFRCTPNTNDSIMIAEKTATATTGILVNLQGMITNE